jgi:DtxR family Mn-dependent transcriptional regulator
VEKRIWELLDQPTASPYGNPIPGLAALGADADPNLQAAPSLSAVAQRLDSSPLRVLVRRIDEPLQTENEVLASLRRAGAIPGSTVKVTRSPGGLLIGSGGEYAEIPLAVADHIAVDPV